jgi:hypothetical protein
VAPLAKLSVAPSRQRAPRSPDALPLKTHVDVTQAFDFGQLLAGKSRIPVRNDPNEHPGERAVP